MSSRTWSSKSSSYKFSHKITNVISEKKLPTLWKQRGAASPAVKPLFQQGGVNKMSRSAADHYQYTIILFGSVITAGGLVLSFQKQWYWSFLYFTRSTAALVCRSNMHRFKQTATFLRSDRGTSLEQSQTGTLFPHDTIHVLTEPQRGLNTPVHLFGDIQTSSVLLKLPVVVIWELPRLIRVYRVGSAAGADDIYSVGEENQLCQ